MTVFILTATLSDGRSVILGVYASKEAAYDRAETLRVDGLAESYTVTETDVIG